MPGEFTSLESPYVLPREAYSPMSVGPEQIRHC